MTSCRTRRLISSQSLKPCSKPGNIQGDTTRDEELRKEQFELRKTTMHTDNIRGPEDMTYSYSFEENAPGAFEYEKELFSRFLQANELEWLAIVSSMNDIRPVELVSFVKVGESVELNYENKLMGHYIGVWLISMGYFEKQTKERLIENVELMFEGSAKAGEVAAMMYDCLFQGYLPADLQMRALLELCRRGWEYLTFLICRLIKALKKISHTHNLYRQLERAIDNI